VEKALSLIAEGKYCVIGIGNMKMACGGKFAVWQPWKVKEKRKEKKDEKGCDSGTGKP
jgi:hypothetical protein